MYRRGRGCGGFASLRQPVGWQVAMGSLYDDQIELTPVEVLPSSFDKPRKGEFARLKDYFQDEEVTSRRCRDYASEKRPKKAGAGSGQCHMAFNPPTRREPREPHRPKPQSAKKARHEERPETMQHNKGNYLRRTVAMPPPPPAMRAPQYVLDQEYGNPPKYSPTKHVRSSFAGPVAARRSRPEKPMRFCGHCRSEFPRWNGYPCAAGSCNKEVCSACHKKYGMCPRHLEEEIRRCRIQERDDLSKLSFRPNDFFSPNCGRYPTGPPLDSAEYRDREAHVELQERAFLMRFACQALDRQEANQVRTSERRAPFPRAG